MGKEKNVEWFLLFSGNKNAPDYVFGSNPYSSVLTLDITSALSAVSLAE